MKDLKDQVFLKRVWVCGSMCVLERERESSSVCVRELGRQHKHERENKCVCVRERERERSSMCVFVCESKCVSEC